MQVGNRLEVLRQVAVSGWLALNGEVGRDRVKMDSAAKGVMTGQPPVPQVLISSLAFSPDFSRVEAVEAASICRAGFCVSSFGSLPHFSTNLFFALAEHLDNRARKSPPTAALLFGAMATFGGAEVDGLVSSQLVARSAEGLEVVPTVRATRGLWDYVVYFKLVAAPTTKAAFAIEAKNLLSTCFLYTHSSQRRGRLGHCPPVRFPAEALTV